VFNRPKQRRPGNKPTYLELPKIAFERSLKLSPETKRNARVLFTPPETKRTARGFLTPPETQRNARVDLSPLKQNGMFEFF
jgi:hypothetical protein